MRMEQLFGSIITGKKLVFCIVVLTVKIRVDKALQFNNETFTQNSSSPFHLLQLCTLTYMYV